MVYKFYYDETEHSRNITQGTLENSNYYENFITVIVGWDEKKEQELEKRYLEFENKYEERKHKGELKSSAIKLGQFKNGFASMSQENLELVSDFLDLFDDDIYIYFSVQSKVEYILLQLLAQYRNNLMVDIDAMRYSLVKAIHVYHPENVIDAMYNRPGELIDEIRSFLKKRIEANKKNLALKQRENEAFMQALIILDDLSAVSTFEWDYHMSFDGFDRFLTEQSIDHYSLIIDREGSEQKTLKAAIDMGHINSYEQDSKEAFGIRMADMLAGIIAKFMKSLSVALTSDYKELQKVLLDKNWFRLDDNKRCIYRKLHHVLSEINDSWYKSFASTYADDLISFISLLEYIDNVSAEEMQKSLEMQGEYFNGFVCDALQQYYSRIHNKLKTEPINLINNEYFFNKWGAKVYVDARKQSGLEIENGMRECDVVNAGMDANGVPTITIKEDDKYVCYGIPVQLKDWVGTIMALKNRGQDMFPARVRFTKNANKWYADLL